jgi:hypothetical protein
LELAFGQLLLFTQCAVLAWQQSNLCSGMHQPDIYRSSCNDALEKVVDFPAFVLVEGVAEHYRTEEGEAEHPSPPMSCAPKFTLEPVPVMCLLQSK